jgi:hypothetical protein
MKVIQREAALLRWGRIDFPTHSYDLVTQQHCTPRAHPYGISLSLPLSVAARGRHFFWLVYFQQNKKAKADGKNCHTTNLWSQEKRFPGSLFLFFEESLGERYACF